MKSLIIIVLTLCICGCGNVNDETAVTDMKGALLIKINNEAANFNIYKFQYEGQEYIIVAGVNGNSIIKK